MLRCLSLCFILLPCCRCIEAALLFKPLVRAGAIRGEGGERVHRVGAQGPALTLLLVQHLIHPQKLTPSYLQGGMHLLVGSHEGGKEQAREGGVDRSDVARTRKGNGITCVSKVRQTDVTHRGVEKFQAGESSETQRASDDLDDRFIDSTHALGAEPISVSSDLAVHKRNFAEAHGEHRNTNTDATSLLVWHSSNTACHELPGTSKHPEVDLLLHLGFVHQRHGLKRPLRADEQLPPGADLGS
mmetsp:Transcript_34131/g.106904  ORF Transcript_34131/g.106904 Transcript_34131/m.106904 type:complete len:243 (+) Transcript_34131:2122-2850(+)